MNDCKNRDTQVDANLVLPAHDGPCKDKALQ